MMIGFAEMFIFGMGFVLGVAFLATLQLVLRLLRTKRTVLVRQQKNPNKWHFRSMRPMPQIYASFRGWHTPTRTNANPERVRYAAHARTIPLCRPSVNIPDSEFCTTYFALAP